MECGEGWGRWGKVQAFYVENWNTSNGVAFVLEKNLEDKNVKVKSKYKGSKWSRLY